MREAARLLLTLIPAISWVESTLLSRRVTRITSTPKYNPLSVTIMVVAATPLAARSALGLPQTVARAGLTWRGRKAARSETVVWIIRRTGTIRASESIRIILA